MTKRDEGQGRRLTTHERPKKPGERGNTTANTTVNTTVNTTASKTTTKTKTDTTIANGTGREACSAAWTPNGRTWSASG
ncbi:hypothetical protein CTA1_11392 [Colletotrichum tanaceti]|uniref:Uncharacterized protein n=1 Tax=Colletotrichum tanaceti TaxID=1306861 RepID=A0A4U6XK67_9PEZI|nr:hypothetical protein CTA1_11392 [Colletotrichum tanaceti]